MSGKERLNFRQSESCYLCKWNILVHGTEDVEMECSKYNFILDDLDGVCDGFERNEE